jgi:biopolymer transport protein ExbB/TolQ
VVQNFSLFEVILKGGWAIGILVILSIIVFAILLDRRSYFKKNLKRREYVMDSLRSYLHRKNYSEALEAADRNGSFLDKVIHAGLTAKTEKTDPAQAMEREAKTQLIRLEQRLPLLATIGSISPFVGLFGTVLGIIRAFQDLALANSGGAAVVSQGIAEALISTAAGLFVAITAVFFYNLFQARLNVAAQEAEIVISEMTERLEN